MNVQRIASTCFLARFLAVATLAFAVAAPALAQGELAVAHDGGRVSASATVVFRIVIPEKVMFDSKSLGERQQNRAAHEPAVQRAIADLGDRRLVTLANP